MTTKTKLKAYEIITNNIINMIEKNQTLPWQKTWNSKPLTPTSFLTKKPYSGTNLCLLYIIQQAEMYRSNLWITPTQATKNGFTIKSGESPYPIVFFKQSFSYNGKFIADSEAEKIKKNKQKASSLFTINTIRFFNVFNLEQTNEFIPEEEKRDFVDPDIDMCLRLVQEMPNAPKVKLGYENALYKSKEHVILLPSIEDFERKEDFIFALFHEAIHSTGHRKSLNRPSLYKYKEIPERSQEELVAHLGAWILCNELGFNINQKREADYVNHWLKWIKDNKKGLIYAAMKASQAVNYILKKTKSWKD